MSGQLSAFEMAFRWPADNGNFQEIQTSNTRKPYIFCDFPGGGGGGGGGGGSGPSVPPSGSAHEQFERDFCSNARFVFFLFDFDTLCPIKNISVKQGQVFLG